MIVNVHVYSFNFAVRSVVSRRELKQAVKQSETTERRKDAISGKGDCNAQATEYWSCACDGSSSL